MNDKNGKFVIDKSKDGYYVAKINKDGKSIYLGSRYNMKRELENFLDACNNLEDEKARFIIFGFGSGEHIKILRKRYINNKIRVFEPNVEIFKYAIKLEYVKNDENLEVINYSNKDFFADNFINEFNLHRIKIVKFSNYDKVYPQHFVKLLNQIKDFYVHMRIERNTKYLFSKRWFETLINNIINVPEAMLFDELKGAYKNKPAIIVSAGPSLDKNIDLLKGIEDEFLIITGGRPLKGILEKNIGAQLLVTIDPSEDNFKLFEDCVGEEKIPLLFFDVTNEKIVQKHKGDKLFSAYNEMFSDIFGCNIELLETYGSVAHTMVSSALLLGCNPIIFIGQDFAYTGDRAHSPYLEEKHNDNNFEEIKRNNDIWVEDINGGLVRTSVELNDFKIGMEKIIEKNPNTIFINATEGGARMKGTLEMSLSDTIKKYRGSNVKKIVCKKHEKEYLEKILKALKPIRDELITIEKECTKGLLYIKELKNIYKFGDINRIDAILSKMEKVDKKILNKLNSFHIIEDLLYPIAYEVLVNSNIDNENNKKTKVKYIIEQNFNLYSNLNLAIKDSLEPIDNAINILKNKKVRS